MYNDETKNLSKMESEIKAEDKKLEELYSRQEDESGIMPGSEQFMDINNSNVEEEMNLNKNRFVFRKRNDKEYITAPIYYVNGEPHIGHLYTSFAVDILARFKRLLSKKVFTSFGTDEHGQKIQTAAKDDKPQDYVDRMHLKFKELLKAAKIEPNFFIRTTDDQHKTTAIYFWERLVRSGLTYEGSYSGWYSERDEAYYKEDEIEDGKAKETGSPVEFLEEKCIFFRLSYMKEALLQHYEQNLDMINSKSRYTEVVNMIKSDLPDLAISRSRFSWGIKVPGSEDSVMYVWVDALSSYLSSIGYPRNTEYNQWWSTVTHIVGKDILKFHAIYWPAMLMAADLQPPKKIFAHGWWTVDGEKMSKSVGNVINPFELIEKYGADSLRYYMFRESNFGNDCNFSVDSLRQTINSELSNELGNLVQRVLAFCSKKFGSTVESPIKAFYSKDCKYENNDSQEKREEKETEQENSNGCSRKINCDSIIKIVSKLEYFYPNQKEENSVTKSDFNIKPDEISTDKVNIDEKENKKEIISNALIIRPNQPNFGDTLKKYWNKIYSFFSGESQNEVEEEQILNEEKSKKSIHMDPELSIEILKEWDEALLESVSFIEEQQISGYVNRLREAIVKTNRYVDSQAPWKHEDPAKVLGILCLCVQRLALLAQPILPEKSAEILFLLGIDGSLKNWLANETFPLHHPKPIFQKS